jgi:ssDNA-binding Zn-finger/Zn-ribbon topoisomerase 1
MSQPANIVARLIRCPVCGHKAPKRYASRGQVRFLRCRNAACRATFKCIITWTLTAARKVPGKEGTAGLPSAAAGVP